MRTHTLLAFCLSAAVAATPLAADGAGAPFLLTEYRALEQALRAAGGRMIGRAGAVLRFGGRAAAVPEPAEPAPPIGPPGFVFAPRTLSTKSAPIDPLGF